MTITILCLALGTLVAGLVLPVAFAAQLITTWRLLTHVIDPEAFTGLDTRRRRPHWHGAIASLALGAMGAVGAFLYWTLS